jgi:probable F420-dependent oxidoreductase
MLRIAVPNGKPLRVDLNIGAELATVRATVEAAEAAGFDGVTISETGRDAFIASTLALEHSRELTVATEVAVAFPRSPMVTAMAAWELHRFSSGRFVLGLGTQVKGHIVRRFSTLWDQPGPRLREYVESLRAIWAAFRGDADLAYSGKYYQFDLLPPEFNPHGSQTDVPVHIAAVNPFNARVAGEVADGIRIHRFHSARYLQDVIIPSVNEGLSRRAPSGNRDVSLCAMVIAVTGSTASELDRAREDARRSVSFYGSTRTYSRVMATEGREPLVSRLHELSVAQQWSEMSRLVDDQFLEQVAVIAPYEELADRLYERYGGVVDRISVRADQASLPHWKRVLEDLRRRTDGFT